MKKYPIGFNTKTDKEQEEIKTTSCGKNKKPRKSVVKVYFPHRDAAWAYYNDSFDLKIGDFVYVDGKLEGYIGQVVEVNYSFKIKISDYKKVIGVVDTNVKGDIYLAGTHIVSFDRNTLPYSKVITWFKAPSDDEEYAIGDDGNCFPFDDLSQLKVPQAIAERGYEYYMENRVRFLEIDGTRGKGIVEGNEIYEVEFDFCDGVVSNLKCSCYCSGSCKHEFAAMLQLKETLELIIENYGNEYNDYFAVILKDVFAKMVLNKRTGGKISLSM